MHRKIVTLSLGCALATLLVGVTAGVAMAAAPANDNYASATVISGFPFTDTVDISGATTETGEPQNCVFLTQSVWYVMTLSSDAVLSVTASVTSGFNPATVNLYQDNGSGFSGLRFIGCQPFSASNVFKVKAGTYRLQIGPGVPGASTLNLTVAVEPPPPNDNFANATPVSGLPFSSTSDLSAATLEPGEPTPTCGGPPVQETVWYVFTPSASGAYVLNMSSSFFFPEVNIYTGSSLGNLVQLPCLLGGPLVFHADAGTTYYLQIVDASFQAGPVYLSLDVAPPVTVNIFLFPSDPSIYDVVQFQPNVYDPAGGRVASYTWAFGDGATSTGTYPYPTHQYAADGNYTVQLTVKMVDGRTGSAQLVVSVRTHDVTISKLTVPQSAQSGQTRSVSVGVTDSRYPEMVRVDLYKSSASGFQPVGSLTQSVPVRGANRPTSFDFSYTFTSDDAALGKVTFRADATIIGARDAVPTDNEVIALPTKVTH